MLAVNDIVLDGDTGDIESADASIENIVGNDHRVTHSGPGPVAGKSNGSRALRRTATPLEAVTHDEDFANTPSPGRLLVDDLISHLLGHVARNGEVVASTLESEK